jgi:hypothetical protein
LPAPLIREPGRVGTLARADQGCAKIYCIDNILQYIVHNTIPVNMLMAKQIAIQYTDDWDIEINILTSGDIAKQ